MKTEAELNEWIEKYHPSGKEWNILQYFKDYALEESKEQSECTHTQYLMFNDEMVKMKLNCKYCPDCGALTPPTTEE